MNPLSKFSLAMAFGTVLFCLLMLSQGFAASATQHDEYVFTGQDKTGKVLVYVEIDRKQGSNDQQQVYIFTEREGWTRIRNAFQEASKPSIGAPNNNGGVFGKLPGKLRLNAPGHSLFLEFETQRIGKRHQGYIIAGGSGKLEWQGRKLEGVSILRSEPLPDAKPIEAVMGAEPISSRESLRLGLLPSGTLHIYRQSSKAANLYEPELGGMLSTDSLSGMIEKVEFKATAWKRIGLYKMPFAWQGSFWVEGKRVLFRISGERLENVGNLLLKGRRLAMARGFVKIDGKSHPAFGLAEVEHFARGQKSILKDEQQVEITPPPPAMTWETAKK